MKNIHILQTEKPSRLVKQKYDTIDRLCLADMATKRAQYKRFNIYITNEEEIKFGDWFKHIFETIHKAGGNLTDEKDFKKIILTTDVNLIKDGVQAIDDEFLEWFIKNPSCEEVKVIKHLVWEEYKIIIPKEEQEKLEKASQKYSNNFTENENKFAVEDFINGAKWQQEKLCNSEIIQRIRASKSDAEARRIIKTI